MDVQAIEKAKLEKKTLEEDSLIEWRAKQEPPLHLSVALKLYELFLNGYTCEDIYNVNGGKYPLGQIIDAKERYSWESNREKQVAGMLSKIEDKIVKAKYEAINVVSDLVNAASKLYNTRIQEYLQTGDESVLETLEITNIKNFKTLVGMLNELTEDKTPTAKGATVNGNVTQNIVQVVENPSSKKKSAAEMLRMLEENGVVNGD